jgi:type IV pilus assembly protein PilW
VFRRARGFTLVELMIAIAVGLFLVGGLLVLLQNFGGTQRNQAALAQLQDNQRIAMTLISEIVESAGYFPDPTVAGNTVTALFPAVGTGTTFGAGQSIRGTRVSLDPGDTLTVRFTTGNNDTVINCAGGTNTSGANANYVNTFKVNTSGQLVCSMNGTDYTLISGLKRMDVTYGLKKDLTVDDNNIDTYARADQFTSVTAVDWTRVASVRVVLTFNNPLYNAAKPQGQSATVTFTRVIAVMNRAGVKT